MGEKKVPAIPWDGALEAHNNGKEVILDGGNSLFGGIPAVDMLGDKLTTAMVSRDCMAESCTILIVHYISGMGLICLFELCVDVLHATMYLEANGLTRMTAMKGNHYVLVAIVGPGMEAPCAIHEE